MLCPHRCDIAEEPEESVRKQRLDAVRRTFLNVYSSMIGFKNGEPGSAFAGLFDSFAEKVGIRTHRSTPV